MRKSKTPPPSDPTPDPPRNNGSEYLPQFVAVAAKLCGMGATDMDLAEALGVSSRTVKRWRVAYPDFAEACKAGKALWDDGVEEAFRKRATGYEYESERVFCTDGKVMRVPIIEHVPPDGWSAFKWLVNRRPDVWRDKVDVMATVRPADVSAEPLSADEWDKRFGSRTN